MTDTQKTLLDAVTFDADGLCPVIAQEARTGMIRMVAWANRQALELTAETKAAHFWSRSRKALWRKGESSGHTLVVREMRIDCDGDVALYLVDAEGPSCHTGATSCFYRRLDFDTGTLKGPPSPPATDSAGQSPPPSTRDDGAIIEDDGPPDPPALVLTRVADVIAERRRTRPEKSYVVSLLDAGLPKINGKIAEESGELIEALPLNDAAHTAHEAADLIFHTLVGLESAGVPIDAVFAQLRKRFGISGLDEKASRRR